MSGKTYPRYYSNQDESRVFMFENPYTMILVRISRNGSELFASVQVKRTKLALEELNNGELIEISKQSFYSICIRASSIFDDLLLKNKEEHHG